MNNVVKILLGAVGVFAIYSLGATFLHTPIFAVGTLAFLLLLACPLMFLFMDHGGHSDEKKSESDSKPAATAHQH